MHTLHTARHGAVHAARAAALAAAALLAQVALAAPQIEEVLTPQRYFQCQIAAQQATLVGMQERAANFGKPATDAKKRAEEETSRARVSAALHGCWQQSGATLGAYAHRHSEELRAWLEGNPQVKAQLEALSKRIAAVSQQMPVAAPSAKR